MAQGRSTEIISMFEWNRTSRLSTKNSLSLRFSRVEVPGENCGPAISERGGSTAADFEDFHLKMAQHTHNHTQKLEAERHIENRNRKGVRGSKSRPEPEGHVRLLVRAHHWARPKYI